MTAAEPVASPPKYFRYLARAEARPANNNGFPNREIMGGRLGDHRRSRASGEVMSIASAIPRCTVKV